MSRNEDTKVRGLSRRAFLGFSGAAAAVAAAAGPAALVTSRSARATRTNAHVVIVGAGAAGLSMASRLSRALDGARITIVDRREAHFYQPGLTLVATGQWDRARVEGRNSDYLPRTVNWVQDMVAAYDPDTNSLSTAGGKRIDYDYLVVASGLKVDYGAIEGMDPALIGRHGIGCVYDNPDNAAATWRAIDAFRERGGIGLFTRAPGAIKCAGAPLKITMLTEHRLRQAGTRGRAHLQYFAPGDGLFSQPDIDSFLKSHMPDQRGIDLAWHHRLQAIDPGARTATFATPEGLRTLDYDFIHVVPPMSAPDAVAASALAWREGPFASGGWLEVDRHTLQHGRYPNVFGVGDVVGTPIGKTAASVKAQTPVAANNLIAVIAGREPVASYNGYTSCPLITEVGQAILVEFDYDLKMVPSFSFIDPTREHWVAWLMKDRMIHAAYNAMLRGHV
jgi:sulfide:quinone oxidoreductase